MNKQLIALLNVRIVAPNARRNSPTSEIIRPHTSTNAETLLFITARSIKSRKYKNMANIEKAEYGNILMSSVAAQSWEKRAIEVSSLDMQWNIGSEANITIRTVIKSKLAESSNSANNLVGGFCVGT